MNAGGRRGRAVAVTSKEKGRGSARLRSSKGVQRRVALAWYVSFYTQGVDWRAIGMIERVGGRTRWVG